MITGEGVLPSSLGRRGLRTLVIGSPRCRAQGPPPTSADTLTLQGSGLVGSPKSGYRYSVFSGAPSPSLRFSSG